MSDLRKLRMTHSVDVYASPETAFALISNVEEWPRIFPPCKQARVIHQDGDRFIVELTADVAGQERTWRSRRRIRRDDLTVDLEQINPRPPMAAVSGYWQVQSLSGRACRVDLVHDFVITAETAAEAAPPYTLDEAEAWVRRACDRNSISELASLKGACEASELQDAADAERATG